MPDVSRVDPRATVRLPAEVQLEKAAAWESILIHDVSVSGALVFTHTPLPSQAQVRIRFRLPGEGGRQNAQVEIDCLAVRSGPLAPSDFEFAFFAGLHFFAFGGERLEQLRTFVWSSREQVSS